MRLVIDTNVLISACLKAASAPRDVIRWTAAHGVFLKSAATEREFRLTVSRPKLARLIVDTGFVVHLSAILDASETVMVTGEPRVSRDPDDDKFLALAVAGRADAIVSGDADLLVLGTYQAIPILAPAAFLAARR